MIETTSDIVDTLETVEEHGFVDFLRATPQALAEQLGIFVERRGSLSCVAVRARPDSILWNHAMGLGRGTPAAESDVEAVDSFFRRHGVQATIMLAPDAGPPELERWLRLRGYAPGYGWAKFRRDTAPPANVATTLEVKAVGRDRSGDFGRVVAGGFSLPGQFIDWFAALPGRAAWHCYVAYDGRHPAGSGALFVDAEIGWLSFGATLPDFRRRGAQSLLLATRIRAAAELGCRWLVTETGERNDGQPEPSYRNILRAGFERAYFRPNFVRPR